jgi:predicted HTH domain antitoxin
MSAIAEPETVYQILVLARQLSTEDRTLLADLLHNEREVPLPNHATLDQAIALYLADACSLGRAAEIAGVTYWDIQEDLRSRGIPLFAAGERSAEEIDALANELEREGLL